MPTSVSGAVERREGLGGNFLREGNVEGGARERQDTDAGHDLESLVGAPERSLEMGNADLAAVDRVLEPRRRRAVRQGIELAHVGKALRAQPGADRLPIGKALKGSAQIARPAR